MTSSVPYRGCGKSRGWYQKDEPDRLAVRTQSGMNTANLKLPRGQWIEPPPYAPVSCWRPGLSLVVVVAS
jgi:hypothetical protein